MADDIPTTILYCPLGKVELELIEQSGFRRFPSRPDEPVLYPAHNEDDASECAKRWHARLDGVGYVTRLQLRTECLARLEQQPVGGAQPEEYRVPADQLEEFNQAIVGPIEVVHTFRSTRLWTKDQRDRLKWLMERFRAAGIASAEAAAESEIEEDIPQLARLLFLRGAWKSVISDDDVSWIEEYRRPPKDPDAPLAGLSGALNRLLAAGADPHDIAEVVRGMQYEVLFSMCYLIADSHVAIDDLDDPTAFEDVGWQLFEVDSEGNIGRAIDCLHEDALATDPTGREMGPRKRSDRA